MNYALSTENSLQKLWTVETIGRDPLPTHRHKKNYEYINHGIRTHNPGVKWQETGSSLHRAALSQLFGITPLTFAVAIYSYYHAFRYRYW